MANIRAVDLLADSGAARGVARVAEWLRAGGNASAARGRRVALLLAAVSLINALDLACTLLASGHEAFREVNPIARALLGNLPLFVAFKALPVALAVLVMARARRRPFVEPLCWGLCGVYSILACVWCRFYWLVA